MDISNSAKQEAMEYQWESHKQTIQKLYMIEAKTREYVMKYMEESYGFKAR